MFKRLSLAAIVVCGFTTLAFAQQVTGLCTWSLVNGVKKCTDVSLGAGLPVNVVSGGGTGGTSSNFNAAFPGTGTAIGFSNGTNMVPGLVDGSGYLEVNVKAGGAGGGAVYGPTANASPSANPPIQIGGTVDGGATSNVATWKVNSSGLGFVSAVVPSGGIASGAIASGAVASGAFASGAVASGAVASGAYASGAISDGADVTLGAKADAKSTATDTTPITAMQVLKEISAMEQAPASRAVTQGTAANLNMTEANSAAILSAVQGPIPAQTPSATTGIGAVSVDPCAYAAKTNVAISMQNTTTVKLVSLASAKQIYICSLSLIASGATVFSVADGTKVSTECDTAAEAVIGAAVASHGLSLAANGGISYGSGSSTVARTTTAAHDLCLFQSGSVDLSGNLVYVQQ